MVEIVLYELGPTRSARCRWALLEAELPYESVGNSPEVIHSDALRELHPLGKLPAALIDGQPLFESAAIATAIADLVPEKGLIGPSGSRARALHDQWVCFALSEMEAWVWSTELNSMDFVIPEEQHVPQIIAQNDMLYRRSAAALDSVLASTDFLVDNRFSVTDIVVGYTLNFGAEQHLHDGLPHLVSYLERLYDQPNCTLTRIDDG